MPVHQRIASPLGVITIQANDEGLTGIWFETQTTQPEDLGRECNQHPILKKAAKEITEYFSGERIIFDLPLSAEGTEFQVRVWNAIAKIPYGATISYQQLASAIQQPNASRAVGIASGKNPISIVVPCHRVIGKKGKLTGYAGGIDRKKWLLSHENNFRNSSSTSSK